MDPFNEKLPKPFVFRELFRVIYKKVGNAHQKLLV
jgi:hypothetical protein